MAVQISKRAPRARCGQCGSTEIKALCHHCGKPLCDKHILKLKDQKGKPLSSEFTELGLRHCGSGEAGIHCSMCTHRTRSPNYRFIGLGIVGAILGILMVMLGVSGSLLVIFMGISIAVIGYQVNQERMADAIMSRPPLPLFPGFSSITLQERIMGSILLNPDGGYCSQMEPAEGMLCLKAELSRADKDRLEEYRKKYRLSGEKSIPFHMGFLLLRGAAGLKFTDTSSELNSTRYVLPLQGTVDEQAYLSGSTERGAGEWRRERAYTILKTGNDHSFPIRIVPSFVPRTGQKALNLMLQWSPELHELKISSIDTFELEVPVSWGKVEDRMNRARVLDEDGGIRRRKIVWKNVSLSDSLDFQACFKLKIENPITTDSVLKGRIEFVCKGTLSGVTDAALFSPLGEKRKNDIADIETRIKIDVELSLSGLRYQESLSIVAPENEKDQQKREERFFKGVIPSYDVVAMLSSAISDQGFYVKRVVENPPRTGERANQLYRCWDIAGRKYLGVYPINFQLLLNGEEVYDEAGCIRGGFCKTTLSVQGTYANSEMEEEIKNVWGQLTSRIRETLQEAPVLAAALPDKEDLQVYPPAVNMSRNGEVLLENGINARLDGLQAQLKQLSESFMAARVFEKAYLEIKNQLEEELKMLQRVLAGH